MKRKSVLICSASAASLLACTTAFAQQVGTAQDLAPQSADNASGGQSGIEDIVVTARRREESLQKVPIAITAITPRTLETQNITSLQEVARLAPGLTTFSNYETDTFIILRAQGGYVATGAPAVASYLDEVPLPGLIGGPGLFYDMQSVQVLKGAQGTLFGRNSTGGAVLQETARPDDRLGGYIQAGYGNYNNIEATGALNLPIVEGKVLLRVAGNYQKRDGWVKVLSAAGYKNGTDFNNRDLKAGRVSLTLKPTEGITNETIFDAYSFRNHGENNILTGINSPFINAVGGPAINEQFVNFLAQQQALGIRTQLASSVYAPNSKKSVALINKTTIELSDSLTFKNIAAYIEVKNKKPFDGDGTPSPHLDFGPALTNNVSKQYTEEAQLQGVGFDDKLKYTVGFFYLHAPKTGFYIINKDLFFGFASSQEQTRQYESSKAAFGQATYSLTDQLNFTAGLRYTKDNRAGETRQLSGPVNGQYICLAPPFAPGDPEYNAADPCLQVKVAKSKRLTGNLSIDFQVNSNLLIYGAVRRGYRAGGPNVQTVLPENATYEQEVLTDYEVGLKADFDLGSIPTRTNLALYHSRTIGWQNSITIAEAPRPTTFVGATTNNPSPANVNGVELEVTAKLTPEVSLNLSGTYTDVNVTLPANTLRGATPKYTANFGLDYTHELGSDAGDINFNLSGNWRSKQFLSGNPDLFDTQKPYALVNISASWDNIMASGINLQAYATNLFNKTYAVGVYGQQLTLGYSSITYAEPRIYGVRARYSF